MSAAKPLLFGDLADLFDWAIAVNTEVELADRTPTADVYVVRADRATAECRVPVAPEEATLRRLNSEFTGLWRVWRSTDGQGRPASWVATNIGVSRAVPTLHEPTPERLEAQMKAPPMGYGGPLTAHRPVH
ncbi:hypothetical protein [Nocardiopsis suaedae]|uniref:Uncharacterized protein n=1 Tax=Nocardiopsis suaedae TaxID=3018444 RepID=A0ABT4TM87_9ACTN|nr:hypothetical protein [Nocardiopsis suaedae]MDA2805807.1 hypothetical protein [Nocardiopsis suaedae]